MLQFENSSRMFLSFHTKFLQDTSKDHKQWQHLFILQHVPIWFLLISFLTVAWRTSLWNSCANSRLLSLASWDSGGYITALAFAAAAAVLVVVVSVWGGWCVWDEDWLKDGRESCCRWRSWSCPRVMRWGSGRCGRWDPDSISPYFLFKFGNLSKTNQKKKSLFEPLVCKVQQKSLSFKVKYSWWGSFRVSKHRNSIADP